MSHTFRVCESFLCSKKHYPIRRKAKLFYICDNSTSKESKGRGSENERPNESEERGSDRSEKERPNESEERGSEKEGPKSAASPSNHGNAQSAFLMSYLILGSKHDDWVAF